LREYRTFTRQLADFAEACGYVMLDQFSSADIDIFYGSWKLGARAKPWSFYILGLECFGSFVISSK
jgi:hypothetical protein